MSGSQVCLLINQLNFTVQEFITSQLAPAKQILISVNVSNSAKIKRTNLGKFSEEPVGSNISQQAQIYQTKPLCILQLIGSQPLLRGPQVLHEQLCSVFQNILSSLHFMLKITFCFFISERFKHFPVRCSANSYRVGNTALVAIIFEYRAPNVTTV